MGLRRSRPRPSADPRPATVRPAIPAGIPPSFCFPFSTPILRANTHSSSCRRSPFDKAASAATRIGRPPSTDAARSAASAEPILPSSTPSMSPPARSSPTAAPNSAPTSSTPARSSPSSSCPPATFPPAQRTYRILVLQRNPPKGTLQLFGSTSLSRSNPSTTLSDSPCTPAAIKDPAMLLAS